VDVVVYDENEANFWKEVTNDVSVSGSDLQIHLSAVKSHKVKVYALNGVD